MDDQMQTLFDNEVNTLIASGVPTEVANEIILDQWGDSQNIE